MVLGTYKAIKKDLSFIGRSMLAGLICSLLLIVAYYMLIWAWVGFTSYNWQLTSIQYFHWALLLLFVTLSCGVISVLLSAPFLKNTRDVLVSGAISGAVFGAIVNLVLFYYPGYLAPDAPFRRQYVTDQLYHYIVDAVMDLIFFELRYFLLFILIGIIIAAISAFIFVTLTRYNNVDKLKNASSLKNKKNHVIIVIAIFLVLLILPPMVAAISIDAGLIKKAHYGIYNVAATVTRPGNDSITIHNNGGQDADMLDPGMPFIITINEKNATNGDAIKASGLQATMTPSSGLGYVPGSFVNLTGYDIIAKDVFDRSRGRMGTHIVATGIFKDESRQVVLDTYV